MTAIKEAILEPWIREFADKSERTYVSSAQMFLPLIFKQAPTDQITWSFEPEELDASLQDLASFRRLGLACGRDLDAYEAMVLWRAKELLAATVWLLNNSYFVAAASTARSVFELAIAYADQSRQTAKLLRDGLDGARSGKSDKMLNNLKEVRARISKAIHGSKMPGAPVNPKNILNQRDDLLKTWDKRLVNVPADLAAAAKEAREELPHVYEYLCDVVHPNAGGYRRFWIETSDEYIVMERHAVGPEARAMLEVVLWSASWASLSIFFSYMKESEFSKLLQEAASSPPS